MQEERRALKYSLRTKWSLVRVCKHWFHILLPILYRVVTADRIKGLLRLHRSLTADTGLKNAALPEFLRASVLRLHCDFDPHEFSRYPFEHLQRLYGTYQISPSSACVALKWARALISCLNSYYRRSQNEVRLSEFLIGHPRYLYKLIPRNGEKCCQVSPI
ncbi:hypothetical protein NEOLEDRAFT_675384 [Neolentinus lepideus HHB14362 ss-1]|uniref:Uncharacterized protein n=1 Tax=Neolentinus lepideus HHB14362 ss-1 TaxID=1314782 RepID=A0A165QCQ3_9AGAM|nr:hypothetical protein NEOLEDRAFT_675384 [Neolentinus lepideus HHB14362 ss-1]